MVAFLQLRLPQSWLSERREIPLRDGGPHRAVDMALVNLLGEMGNDLLQSETKNTSPAARREAAWGKEHPSRYPHSDWP